MRTFTPASAQQPASSTPDDLLKRGPTFVLGTAGSEREDKAIEVQGRMLRDLFFPNASIASDVSIDAGKVGTTIQCPYVALAMMLFQFNPQCFFIHLSSLTSQLYHLIACRGQMYDSKRGGMPTNLYRIVYSVSPDDGASFDAAIRLSTMARLDLPCRADTVLLGNLALHCGKRIDWDAKAMKAKGCPEVDALTKPAYRSSWS